MSRTLFIAKSAEDLERCFPVMKELRPHLSFADYAAIYEDAHRRDGYEIVGIEDGGRVLAVMGYRFLSDFVRGRHLYVDDLVSSESVRSQGLGAELLKHAEEIARGQGCGSLRLCTGLENHGGVKFYERNGWTRRSYAFVKKLQ